jgi:hypothetical protein
MDDEDSTQPSDDYTSKQLFKIMKEEFNSPELF